MPLSHRGFRLRATSFAMLLLASPLAAQRGTTRAAGPSPGTEIFLVSLSKTAGRITTTAPRNVTNRDGYDNQPSFAADSRSFFFTANLGDGQTDIYRYDITRGRAVPVRLTKPESEYSAALTNDGQAIAVIRVEADSTQRLWRLPLDTTKTPSPIFTSIKPVGYFAQADDTTWVMFVLGSPATLQVAHRTADSGVIVARNIGRSIRRIPGSSRVSYVQKGGDRWYVMSLDPKTGRADTLVATRPGSEDIAWIDANTIVAGEGGKLFTWHRGESEWRELADYSASLDKITRIAVSPDGKLLSLVAEAIRRP